MVNVISPFFVFPPSCPDVGAPASVFCFPVLLSDWGFSTFCQHNFLPYGVTVSVALSQDTPEIIKGQFENLTFFRQIIVVNIYSKSLFLTEAEPERDTGQQMTNPNLK